jgi:hypothetical protein
MKLYIGRVHLPNNVRRLKAKAKNMPQVYFVHRTMSQLKHTIAASETERRSPQLCTRNLSERKQSAILMKFLFSKA